MTAEAANFQNNMGARCCGTALLAKKELWARASASSLMDIGCSHLPNASVILLGCWPVEFRNSGGGGVSE